MALNPGEYRSGGNVVDGEGRRVLAIAGGAGLSSGEYRSGSRVFDSDGREVVSASGVAGGSGATTVFRPETYGGAANGVTNSTSAINSAISNAVDACILDGTNYCEVQLSAGRYIASDPTTKSATYKSNSQIVIPLIPVTDQKVTLVLKGTVDASGVWPHWQQTVAAASGSIIESTLTGQTVDGTWGPPAVIGGPTPQQGYGYQSGAAVFSNMLVVLDGVAVLGPAGSTLMGFDFGGLAQAKVISAAAMTRAIPSSITRNTNSWVAGLRMPLSGNNMQQTVLDFACQGYFYGIISGEHLAAHRLGIVYCDVGIALGDSPHGSWIGYAGVEACRTSLQVYSEINSPTCIYVDMLDVEDGAGQFAKIAHVDDSTNQARGYVGYMNNLRATAAGVQDSAGTEGLPPTVTGTGQIEVVNLRRARGTTTAPTLPASTVALTNPFYRDAAVVVFGGTVTAITVDGQASGLTSGTVIVPTGKTIAVTYSVAPTWRWTLL